MRFHLKGITNVETVDVTEARNFFEESADFKTGDELYDSAVDYFGNMFFQSIDYKHKYRAKHHQIMSYISLEEAEVMTEGYQRMFERVVDARRFLEVHAETLVTFWQKSKYGLRSAYTDVLADIISNSPQFIDKYFEGDEGQYNRDCFNTVQWLDGWLRHEKILDGERQEIQAHHNLRAATRQLLFSLGVASNPFFSDRNIIDELRKKSGLEPLTEYDETPKMFAIYAAQALGQLGSAIDEPELVAHITTCASIIAVD